MLRTILPLRTYSSFLGFYVRELILKGKIDSEIDTALDDPAQDRGLANAVSIVLPMFPAGINSDLLLVPNTMWRE